MSFEILNRYAEIDQLLRRKETGTRKQLAEKLDVSVRSLYRYKENLEKFGAEIAFDDKLQSYYYVKPPTGLFASADSEMETAGHIQPDDLTTAHIPTQKKGGEMLNNMFSIAF